MDHHNKASTFRPASPSKVGEGALGSPEREVSQSSQVVGDTQGQVNLWSYTMRLRPFLGGPQTVIWGYRDSTYFPTPGSARRGTQQGMSEALPGQARFQRTVLIAGY